MPRKVLFVLLGSIAAFVLMSCGGGPTGLPGTEIYTVTVRQLPDKPSTLEVTINVDPVKKAALKTELGSAYSEPQEVYVWMAFEVQNQDFQSSNLHPVLKVPVSPDKDSFVGYFDILAHAPSSSMYNYDSGSFSWLQSWWFDENSTSQITGAYAFVSDGWTYSGSNNSGYGISIPFDEFDSKAFNFNERLPKGTGRSNYYQYPPANDATITWVPVIRTAGSVTTNWSEYEIAGGDQITITYKSPTNDSVTLNLNGWGTLAPFNGGQEATTNLYVKEFTVNLTSGAPTGTATDDGSGSGTIHMIAGTYFNLNLNNAANGLWFSQGYQFAGDIYATLLNESFDGTVNWTFKTGGSGGTNNWVVGDPSLTGDRSTNVTSSSGNALLVRGAGDASTFGTYDPNRYMWFWDPSDSYASYDSVSIPIPSPISAPSLSKLRVSMAQRSDFASGDGIYVYARDANTSQYKWVAGIDKYNQSLGNTWSNSIVDGWDKSSWSQSLDTGMLIDEIRLLFYSDANYQSRGISLDNLKVEILQ